jgi:glycosyltransferase involved in cell wall biosynthesis
MFAGRIERNKGVFDIVEIAGLLESKEPGRVVFDICGTGSALEELNDFIQRTRLGRNIRTHGKLVRPDLLKRYAACHAVIVPTRSEFNEGMAMVAVEAILCCRPVIASPLVPAVELLSGAVAIATPDDPLSYADAIWRLVENAAYYERLCAACISYREQFYDPRKGLAAALETVFAQRASAIS